MTENRNKTITKKRKKRNPNPKKQSKADSKKKICQLDVIINDGLISYYILVIIFNYYIQLLHNTAIVLY